MPARRRTLTRLVGLLTIAVLATGCDSAKWSRGGWPSPVTEQGEKVLGLWRGSLITALIVGAFVTGLIIWSAIWFRRRGDEMPRQVRYNLPIEVLYTIIPVVMVAILFYFTAIRENDATDFKQTPKLRIGVVGFQWSWQFNYLNDGLSVTGRPGDPPQLVLPVGVPIRFYETSPDVIHAWWVIPFLFKRDVIPGRVNSFELTVTKTGTFDGKCTEYCGVDHDRMLFTVRAVSMGDYQKWLAQEKTIASQGTDPRVSVYNGPTTPTNTKPGTTQRSTQ